MATIRNPINQNTIIDLSPVLENIPFQYGQYADSGLFNEKGITATSHMYRVKDVGTTKMTKLTSRVERNAMAIEKQKEKLITMGAITIKETGGVHVEDLIGVSSGIFDEDSTSFQEATVEELTRLTQTGAANYEYLITTATQGRVLDPLNGSVAIDNFLNTGTTQTAFTIDANPANSITESLNALVNQISSLNGYNGNVGMIEVVVGEQAFSDIVGHPDFAAMYQLSFTGLGNAALQQPMINGTIGRKERTAYGHRRTFVWDNLMFVTYPQKFQRWDGESVSIIGTNKGWTIVEVAGLYEVRYAPAPYVSSFKNEGVRWTARSTGIINDTHTDMSLECHMIPYMKRPEMSIDITVVTA
jgi:hypothetical protein